MIQSFFVIFSFILFALQCCISITSNQKFRVNNVSSEESDFTLYNISQAICINDESWCDEYWPSEEDGKVLLYESQEIFNGEKLRRDFYVYIPNQLLNNTEETAPALIYLHGGYSNALTMFERPFTTWASGKATKWYPNTETCQFVCEEDTMYYWNTKDNSKCFPPSASSSVSEPFIVVYPDGLPDYGQPNNAEIVAKSHWEDGRSPSPGYYYDPMNTSDEAQYRDDVGFLNHIVSVLHNRDYTSDYLVDNTRTYLMGDSNGGMMTLRGLCSMGSEQYPSLNKIAAFGVSIAQMPANIYDGASGRAKCAPTLSIPTLLIAGYNLDTPDCEVYGCTSPVVSGDFTMPFGDGNSRYTVDSPSLGVVISHEYTLDFIVNINNQYLQTKISESNETVGYFTNHFSAIYSVSNEQTAVVESYISNGACHMINGNRADINTFEVMYAFVSQFRRDAEGTTTLR